MDHITKILVVCLLLGAMAIIMSIISDWIRCRSITVDDMVVQKDNDKQGSTKEQDTTKEI